MICVVYCEWLICMTFLFLTLFDNHSLYNVSFWSLKRHSNSFYQVTKITRVLSIIILSDTQNVLSLDVCLTYDYLVFSDVKITKVKSVNFHLTFISRVWHALLRSMTYIAECNTRVFIFISYLHLMPSFHVFIPCLHLMPSYHASYQAIVH